MNLGSDTSNSSSSAQMLGTGDKAGGKVEPLPVDRPDERLSPPKQAAQKHSNTAATRAKRKYKKRAKEPVHLFPVQPRVVQIVKKPKTFVNHSYNDFSCVPPEAGYLLETDISQMTFSQKIHHMLSDDKLSHCITWMPHGRSFKVVQPTVFEKQVLPLYFSNLHYSRFKTQLRRQGFKEITVGADQGSYYHECFLRGHPHLCKYMPIYNAEPRRKKPDPENEPDFYEMSKLFPVDRKVSLQGSALANRQQVPVFGNIGGPLYSEPLERELRQDRPPYGIGMQSPFHQDHRALMAGSPGPIPRASSGIQQMEPDVPAVLGQYGWQPQPQQPPFHPGPPEPTTSVQHNIQQPTGFVSYGNIGGAQHDLNYPSNMTGPFPMIEQGQHFGISQQQHQQQQQQHQQQQQQQQHATMSSFETVPGVHHESPFADYRFMPEGAPYTGITPHNPMQPVAQQPAAEHFLTTDHTIMPEPIPGPYITTLHHPSMQPTAQHPTVPDNSTTADLALPDDLQEWHDHQHQQQQHDYH